MKQKQNLDQHDSVYTDSEEVKTMTQKDIEAVWQWNKLCPEQVERCVHDIFEKMAQVQPNSLAICAWDGQLLYGELDQLATNLANWLIDLGVGPGMLIPLSFEKSMWTTVCMLGVLKSGGGFVMLDASLPEQRLQTIVRQLKPTMILCSVSNQSFSARLAPEVITISRHFFKDLEVKANRHTIPVDPMSVMYLAFSSGSTGIPKGVMITHSNFASALNHQAQHLKFTRESRTYDFSSYAFDASISNTFTTLAAGGCLCVPTEQDRTNRLAESITSLRANFIFLTPSVSRLLDPKDTPTLQSVIFGGEALHLRDVERWWGKVRIIQAYGPSECTPYSLLNSDAPSPQEAIRIGKGVGQVTWIVDPEDHDRLVPLGCTGELLLEGPLVGKGYLDDAEKDAKAFIQDPVWLRRGAPDQLRPQKRRIYKTGDLVKYNEDGSLTYVGRKDTQVKIHGQRAELGEIELQIQEHMPEGKLVVADIIKPEGETSNLVLAAFIQMYHSSTKPPQPQHSIEIFHVPINIKENLATHLPRYMVPTVFFSVPELPIIVTGKLDRKKLCDLGTSCFQQFRELQRQKMKPNLLSRSEQELQKILGRALSLDPALIGPEDNFFQLGGDSIAAMQVVFEAHKAGIEIRVSDIFQHPTIGILVSQEHRSANKTPEVIPPFSLLGDAFNKTLVIEDIIARYKLGPATIEDAYPCTPLQEGLLSLSLKYPGEYTIQRTLEIHSSVVTSDFCQAWERLARETAILRTRIVQTGDMGLLQLVLNEEIQWTQRSGLDEYLKEDRQMPMELGQPLARYAFITDNSSARRWFVWTLHHALYDGWSLPLMIDMVDRVYRGIPTKPTKYEFKSFIKYIGNQSSEKMANYWRNALANCDSTPFPALPSSVLRPVVDSEIYHRIPWLETRPRIFTTSTLVRAAWALFAGCMTNSDNVVFGITTSGRSAPVGGIDEVVGPTITTVPLYVRIIRSQKALEFLSTMQQQTTDMIPFEQFGLHRIAKTCPEAQQACMFQTLLLIQPKEKARADDTYGQWEESYEPEWVNTYALVLEVQIGMKRVKARFDSNVIKPWIVRMLLEGLEFVMKQLDTALPEQIIAEIELVTPRSLERIWDWNRTVPSPVEAFVHHMIEGRMQNQPMAMAICAWDGELTYRELDRLATEVAAQLVKLGVGPHLLGPDMLVPLCFEKSKWTIVSMLGVLKSGAGFVLLDPSLPEARLQSILLKVRSKVMLSSQANMELSLRLSEMVVQIGPDISQIPSHVSSHATSPTTLLQPSLRIMYAVFTSGSTGAPKGVLVSHENFCSAVHYQLELLSFTRESKVLDFASYAFDAAIHNAIATLVAGGCLCIPSEKTRKDNIGNIMDVMRPTIANLTPTVARLLDQGTVHDLRTLILLGEPVTTRDAERWRSHKVHLINTYGPAECTPISTINPSGFSTEEAIRIGKGVGLVTWIVTPGEHDRLVPPGCTGELLLEGPLVGNGYLEDPEKTAEAFIEGPDWLLKGSHGQPGRHGRLYKTGDLVQYNKDGSLTFMGRKDNQVKIRGQRFELGEVEHHIQECLSTKAGQIVTEVIVPEGETNPRPALVAFIQVGEHDIMVDEKTSFIAKKYPMAADIKKKLAHHLPSYMVPTEFFSVPDLPLTPTGKTNRRRLREIGRELLLAEGEGILDASGQSLKNEPPRSESILVTEQPAYALAQKVNSMRPSWTHENLPVRKDGPQHQQIELNDVLLHSAGLDSVNMMELTSFISQNFHIQVGMQFLMDKATTIRSLAQCLVDSQTCGAENHPNGNPSTRPLISVDLMAEIRRHESRILTAQEKSASHDNTVSTDAPVDKDDKSFNVFLTGANGFIGTQILRQLLEHRHVNRVIALVRGDTDDTARRRTIDRAVKALWWTNLLAEKLEVWRGDLSLPNLGLDSTRWNSLASGQAVDIIIHNGATVHWTKSYRALEAANVGSTMELLLLALGLPRMRFVYITGGRPWDSHEELDVVKELSAADAVAYSQTKFVAEVVVKRGARRSPNRLAVLNPGWVIGTPTEGFSNADDYIWRLAATCTKINAYNADQADGWLFLSDVASTATAIVDTALGTKMEIVAEKHPVYGMTWREFWAILGGLGYRLKAKDMAEWLALVRADIEAASEKHPLWPLAHMIEGLQNDERVASSSREKRGHAPLRLKVAVSKSAEFLVRAGFLPKPPDKPQEAI
jgi:amino acid adenylation domain-containing protein/thioester reductase-like protein